MLYMVLSYDIYVIHGLSYILYVVHGFILYIICYTWFILYIVLYMVLSNILCYTWFYPVICMLYIVLAYVFSVEDFYLVLYKFRRHLSMCLSNVNHETTRYWDCFAIVLLINTVNI